MELVFHDCLQSVVLTFSNFIGNIRTKPLDPMALVSSIFKFFNACQLRDEQ
jgi:hypothetical protein